MVKIESGNLIPRSGKFSSSSPLPISHFLGAALIGAVLTGCGTPAFFDNLTDSHTSSSDMNIFGEGKYISFAHAFTDAAAESVRRSAERHCAQTKLVAVKTSGTCS